ncbi:hypothetical protein H2198_005803 [Neophaeococcomyces mojaviensis]|uniref:Uncharacterized protein n=1 Tax=Neophaeococcomyces mojaviensis TaxID=3383035 RepID=A0ACC3A4L3_9EURO|nr:hypothetical protein H2198_005803 [Knufia sp. JES_112]
MSHDKRASLLSSSQSFCDAFASQAPLDDILRHFSSSQADDIVVHEHGLKELAPFLGRDFTGAKGVKSYFEIIASCLSYEKMSFKEYIVDALENKTSVRGEARFTWTSTKQSWDEVFTYVLGFDEEGKVLRYEVWADTGAAYLASKGQLEPTG